MQNDCLKCGGNGLHCYRCNSPAYVCECFEDEAITNCPKCNNTPLIEGGQGRSADELQMAADNLAALSILLMVVIIGVIIISFCLKH